MRVDQRAMSDLIAGVYDCALNPDQWNETLGQFGEIMGARLTAMLVTDPGLREISAGSGVTEEMRTTYRDHFGGIDPVSSTLARMPSGVVATALEMRDLPEWEQEQFYQDWARPHGIGEFIAATYARNRDSVHWLVVSAPWDMREYASEDRVRLVRFVLPHVERAASVGNQLALMRAHEESLLEALSNIGHGVILLSARGEVLLHSGVAASQLAARDGLTISRTGRLSALDPRDDARLARIIAKATGVGAEGIRSGGSIGVSRPSLRRPYYIQVTPLGRTSGGHQHGAAAMVVVIDPTEAASPSREVLGDLFGLTPAETSVALAVMQGGGLQQVADHLHVSLSTVRIHLQHAFEKTDTHGQVELTTLLSSLQPVVSTG